MNTTRNFEENLTEMVFENKNKAYGAYAIRKAYHDNVTISLVLSSAFFGLLALLAVSFTTKTVEVPDSDMGNKTPIITKTVEMFIEPKDPKPIEKKEEAPKTESGIKEASDVLQKSDGTINENQNISKNPNPLGVAVDTTGKKTEPMEPFVPEKKEDVVTFVDVAPQLKNMTKFIKDNLKYPWAAKSNGTSGVVYLTFVVEKDGRISDIKLLKGIGDGCEQEAMRVVGIMPPWEPGTTKNIPKRVQCTLPINFVIK